MSKPSILFVCVRGAGRSQMAARTSSTWRTGAAGVQAVRSEPPRSDRGRRPCRPSQGGQFDVAAEEADPFDRPGPSADLTSSSPWAEIDTCASTRGNLGARSSMVPAARMSRPSVPSATRSGRVGAAPPTSNRPAQSRVSADKAIRSGWRWGGFRRGFLIGPVSPVARG